jgi:hypothetical protein
MSEVEGKNEERVKTRRRRKMLKISPLSKKSIENVTLHKNSLFFFHIRRRQNLRKKRCFGCDEDARVYSSPRAPPHPAHPPILIIFFSEKEGVVKTRRRRVVYSVTRVIIIRPRHHHQLYHPCKKKWKKNQQQQQQRKRRKSSNGGKQKQRQRRKQSTK